MIQLDLRLIARNAWFIYINFVMLITVTCVMMESWSYSISTATGLSPKLIWSSDSKLCGSVGLIIHYRHLIFVEQMQMTYAWSCIIKPLQARSIVAMFVCMRRALWECSRLFQCRSFVSPNAGGRFSFKFESRLSVLIARLAALVLLVANQPKAMILQRQQYSSL